MPGTGDAGGPLLEPLPLGYRHLELGPVLVLVLGQRVHVSLPFDFFRALDLEAIVRAFGFGPGAW